MAKATAEKPLTLSERLAIKPSKQKETWFTRLPEDFQQQLLQLRIDYHANKFPTWSIRAMHQWLTDEEEFGADKLIVGKSTFQLWMLEKKRG